MVCVHQWEWGCAQNKGLGYDNTYSSTHLPTFWPSSLYCSSSRLIVYSLSRTSEHLQPTGEDRWLPLVPYFLYYSYLCYYLYSSSELNTHLTGSTTLAFISMSGRTYLSPGLFRMTRAVLSILVIFVCLAHTLAIRPKLLVNMSGLFLLCKELQFFWIQSTMTFTYLNR